jgi:hypothetical protein
MNDIVNYISNLIATIGWYNFLAVVVVFALTEAVKYPLKDKMEQLAAKTNQDKAVYTAYLVFLPMVVSAVVGLLWYMWRTCRWNPSKFLGKEWVIYCGVLYGQALGFYEFVSVWVKKVLSKEKKAIAAATGSKEVDALSLTQIRVAYKAVKAADKQAKAKQKAEAKAKAEQEAKANEAKQKADKIAELEKELAEAKAK